MLTVSEITGKIIKNTSSHTNTETLTLNPRKVLKISELTSVTLAE
jgi:hypothetical protein